MQKFFLFFVKKLLTKFLTHSIISNVSGRHNRHNNLCASGSVGGARPCQGRGRGFESRLALSFNKKDIRWMSFFVKSSPAGLDRSRSTLRSGPRRADVHWTSCAVSRSGEKRYIAWCISFFRVLPDSNIRVSSLRSLPNSVHRTLTSSLRSGPRRTDKFYLPLSNGIMIFR